VTFRLRLIESGPVPPAGGPARTRYLLLHGENALTEARALEASALATLGLRGELPRAVVTGDLTVDLATAADMREQWDQLLSGLSSESLLLVKPDVMRAADLATQALNFLEDLPLAGDAHDLLHSTALLRGALYGCPFWVENGEVWTDCPVRISHLRFGVSVEMSTVWHCSICGLRFDLCEHDPDALYEVEAQRTSESCTVCFGRECEHEVGVRYLVHPIAVADSISAGAVAWVARPRYPQARVVRMTLDYEEGSDEFTFAERGDLACHLCRLSCPGLRDPKW
jgi:hypothetical protein